MAYIPPAAAGVDPWLAYRNKYGPVSIHEKTMGVEKALAANKLLDKVANLDNSHFIFNDKNELDVVTTDSHATKDQFQRIHDEVQKTVDHIYHTFLTLPAKTKTTSELASLIDKEVKLNYLQEKVLAVFKHTFSDERIASLNSYELPFKNFKITLGHTSALFEENQLKVKVVGSICFNTQGRGLKIELKANGRVFANAFIQSRNDELIVWELNSLVEADTITRRFDFVFVMTKILFNIFQAQGSSHMIIHLKQQYFESAAIGLIPEPDRPENYKAELCYARDRVKFEYFGKALTLEASIVPKCD